MNVFVLCTGRCGSTTFAQACRHISNYTTAHQSNWGEIGESRLAYSDHHIEVDNRLAWMLGELDQRFGRDAFYVHLRRGREETASSFNKRWDNPRSIIRGYGRCILSVTQPSVIVCQAYVDCVNANIQMFLKDKPYRMNVELECAGSAFREFWEQIGAQGDLEAAVRTFSTTYNASGGQTTQAKKRIGRRMLRTLLCLARR